MGIAFGSGKAFLNEPRQGSQSGTKPTQMTLCIKRTAQLVRESENRFEAWPVYSGLHTQQRSILCRSAERRVFQEANTVSKAVSQRDPDVTSLDIIARQNPKIHVKPNVLIGVMSDRY